jgi:hypothetical protein
LNNSSNVSIPYSSETSSTSFGESSLRYNLFSNTQITPASTDKFERRLERLVRELARLIMQRTIRNIESNDRDQTVSSFNFGDESYRRNRRTTCTIDTRFGAISFDRWYFQSTQAKTPGIAPLEVRLGIVAGRMTPALAEVTGRLAADLPQQAARDMLAQRFGVTPSVEAYRRVVADLATQVRGVHDQEAIGQLIDWIKEARRSDGKHDVLLQVGRDGVFVQTRPCWEEASCATIAVYDRNRNRVGTVYLGQMPESEQPTMTRRLTTVIQGVLEGSGSEAPKLRYVTDAGCHPQAYYREVLCKMKHPLTGRRLKWTWCVDFFHACEYVSQLAASLFGTATDKAHHWAKEQRSTLRHENNGIKKVIARAAQQKRRGGLKGTKKDFAGALNYLKKYKTHMDYAERKKQGDPIGSGITEAGCKVIFNQRLKQSGMRWHRATGQFIVDLRTANRSGIWDRIWTHLVGSKADLPPISYQSPIKSL